MLVTDVLLNWASAKIFQKKVISAQSNYCVIILLNYVNWQLLASIQEMVQTLTLKLSIKLMIKDNDLPLTLTEAVKIKS